MKKKILFSILIAVLMLSGCGEAESSADSPIIDVSGEPIASVEDNTATGEVTDNTSTSVATEEKGTLSEKPWLNYTGAVTAIGERTVVDGKMQSWLTGEWKDVSVANRRPIAVMIPDNTPALPQYGLSLASVVYESPVEGRFTRLMGIFEDYDELDRIGPVRSSRRYYVDEAISFDAIYCNWGLARAWVEEIINSDKIDNVSQALAGINNGAPEAYGRVSRPGYATEFTGYLMLDGYKQAVERLGYETEYRKDRFKYNFQIADDDCWATYADKTDITEIWPGGSGKNSGGYGNYGENNVHFEYNAEDGLYYRYQYGGAQIDEYNNEQIAVRNVILKVCVGGEHFPDNASYDYLWFETTGQGGGYIFTNGKMIPCLWSREDLNSPTVYTDANGNEIILNQGKTWICNIWSDYQQYIELK